MVRLALIVCLSAAAVAALVLLTRADGGDDTGGSALSVERVGERIERIRGHRFESLPALRIVDEHGMNEALMKIAPLDTRPRFDATRQLVYLTGIGTPEDVVSSGTAVGAHVADGDGTVYVLRERVQKDPRYAEHVLAHELVHELDHERFRVDDRLARAFDEDQQAREAAAEGSASFAEALYISRHQNGDSVGKVLRSFEREAWGGPRPDPFDVLSSTSYVDGTRYAAALHRRGGWAAVDAALADPPDTTAEILHPGESVTAVRVRAPAGRSLARGWHRMAALDFGEPALVALLAVRRPLADARRLAAAWRGGRASVWRTNGTPGCLNDCSGDAATIKVVLRDVDAARRVAAALDPESVARRGRVVAASFAARHPEVVARLSREAVVP